MTQFTPCLWGDFDICLFTILSSLFNFLCQLAKYKLSPFLNSVQKWMWWRCKRVVCVFVSDEVHVNYLNTDVPCHCQTENFYPSYKAALRDVSPSAAHITYNTAHRLKSCIIYSILTSPYENNGIYLTHVNLYTAAQVANSVFSFLGCKIMGNVVLYTTLRI